jgi:hypothetical protein
VELRRIWRLGKLTSSLTDDQMLNGVASLFAEQFLVSLTAMRIRLEKLGLLLREVPQQRTRTVGA